jgi:hypothetical protein
MFFAINLVKVRNSEQVGPLCPASQGRLHARRTAVNGEREALRLPERPRAVTQALQRAPPELQTSE